MVDHYVLLIDSDEEFASEMETVLSGAGIDLIAAATPAQAIQLIKTITPAAVILDMDRPARESMRLLSDMRAKGIEPAVLWITSHMTQAGFDRVRASGAQGILLRESDTVTRVCAVRAILAGDSYFPRFNTTAASPAAKAVEESERIIKLLHLYARES